MIKRTKFALLIGVLFLQGCGGTLWVAWVGYESPRSDSFATIPGCDFEIGVQNLTPPELGIVKEAASKICNTMESRAFLNQVAQNDWIASCGSKRSGENKMMAGAKVAELIEQPLDKFSVYINKPASATGQAHPAKQRIAIAPSRIASWLNGDQKPFYTTMSHEMLHLISTDFKDRGHGTEKCPDSQLVSYGVSVIVAEMIVGN